MKQLNFIAAIAISTIVLTSCGDNNGGSATGTDTTKTDSSAAIIPPPDNSSATNPSLADTAFSKNDSAKDGMKKDSSKMKH